MHRVGFAAFALSLLVACGQASVKRDFSGTWRFDAARSILQGPAPDSSVFFIEHSEPLFRLLRIHYHGENADTFSIELTTDGVQVDHSHSQFHLQGRAFWDDEALVFESVLSIEDEQGTNIVRYTLSDDGRTLTADEHFVMGQVSHENKWVFEKL